MSNQHFSHHFLRVVAGYPTFIEFYYPRVENLTDDAAADNDQLSFSPVWSMSPKKLLNWSCDFFPGDATTCKSTITSDRCRNDTQFSAGYWRTAKSCEKESRLVPCVNVILTNNTCQNTVLEVHNGSTIHLVLKDLQLPSTAVQSYAEHYSSYIKPKCYYPSLPVSANKPLYFFNTGLNEGCKKRSSLVKFGINTTIECLVKRSVWKHADECPSVDRLRELFISNVSYICNCDSCDVPLLQQPSPVLHYYNTTSCLIPHQAILSFTHVNGFINSAYLRFQLQRGRFHCPSDTTCWKELWFPLEGLPSSVTLQIGFAIITVMFFMLSTKRRMNSSHTNCDCQFAISKLKI